MGFVFPSEQEPVSSMDQVENHCSLEVQSHPEPQLCHRPSPPQPPPFSAVSSPSCTWGRSQWKLKPASPGASRGSCSPAHPSTQQSPAGEWVCPCPSLLPTESSPPSPQSPRSSGSPCPPTTPPTHYPRPRDRHPLTGLLTPLHPLHSCRMSAPAPFPFCSLSHSGRQTIHKARGGRSPLLLPR
nr:vegetative cell wall protein gp1-like [Globicephala melas]